MHTTPDDISGCEVADVFRLYGKAYRDQNKMTVKQHKVMSSIEACRTSDYGYHVDQCDACGYTETDFNSCRDRHCPTCQGVSRRIWVDQRLKDILPLPYYHAVFTLPHHLIPLVRYNKRLTYELLLSTSSDTLLTFGRDPKWLGGEIGFYGILHTRGIRVRSSFLTKLPRVKNEDPLYYFFYSVCNPIWNSGTTQENDRLMFQKNILNSFENGEWTSCKP